MARRKYKSKMNKIEPSEMTLTFATAVTSAGSQENHYIDLSQVASLVNRRFYRQGINWAVSGFKFLVGAGFGTVSIQKLPNTWTMSNSWEKGMRTWIKMVSESSEESSSVRPRFMDFKIYADADHHNKGFGANLLPLNTGGTAAAGEWSPSTVHIPQATNAGPATTTDAELIAVGANWPPAGPSGMSAVSLIEGYAASRALPNIIDPNTPDDATDVTGGTPENWISAIFNEGNTQDEEVITDLQNQNSLAPYPFENDGVSTDTMYPGGANQMPGLSIHDLVSYTATTVGGKAFGKGGNFPCGLIKLTHEVPLESIAHNLLIQIDLVPGSHRGYLCENMTEM